MRIIFLADIHSNLEALEKTREVIKNYTPDKIICLGDVVGYAASPDKTLEMVRDLSDEVVAGNHDWATCGRFDLSQLNSYAKEAILWTGRRIKEENRTYLASLSLVYEGDNFIGVHGSIFEPCNFYYLDNYPDIERNFSLMKKRICFVAHTHIPAVFIQKGSQIYRDYSSDVELKPEFKYIINVGSVGQPRDRDPRACFCLWEENKNRVRFIRVPYDIKKTQKLIWKEGLPSLLAQRLEMGW